MTLRERPSPNFDDRTDGQPVDMLVLHYTGMPTAEEALERLCDAAAQVSAHYLIEEDGTLWRLTPEEMRAWHAGVSQWRGATNINARSIGIELVNPGHEWGYCAFPEPQMTTLIDLSRDIVGRHAIPARNVVGHSDVAPRRKQDPGELFDWPRLATAGVGLWPANDATADSPPAPREAARWLSEIGYETEDLKATAAAFQRHYRPSQVDGEIDAETAMLARAIRDLVTQPDG